MNGTKTVKSFASVCKSVQASSLFYGTCGVERTVIQCTEECAKILGTENFQVEGLTTTVVSDKSVMVTLLASVKREVPEFEEE